MSMTHLKMFFVSTSFVSFIIFYSFLNLLTGNLFFGKIPYLYNLNLANFFFIQASYPPTGKALKFAHYQLGRTYFIKGQLQGAIEEINKEVALYPENIRAQYMLGLTYGYMNKEEKAIEAFAKFIEWKPESWAARNDKAWLEFRIGDIDAALETITPVTHLTDNAWVQNTYGVMLMNKKKYKEAKVAFDYAKVAADKLTEKEWGKVYPGNDPRVYGQGLRAAKKSIESNLRLVEEKMAN
ncbi:MAG: tetratricopeptide repeat protein [Candidatus Pacebacteria bacterium]|nr:tetratricopeptide repeat protein [Candidatus Paceibacterota bacterium]